MSRAYRIRVRESLTRVLKAHDRVSTELEILEILPPEQMSGLLEQALSARGFQKRGDGLVRQQKGGITVSVDCKSGTVTVQAEAVEHLDLELEKEGRAYDDGSPQQLKKSLQQELQQTLQRQADEKQGNLQRKVTDRLEDELKDLRQELDQAVNRVTAEALKQKAAQLGQIKQMSEDPQTGSLTIVLEV